MKIGILTYHRVVNDGSIIQAYCLEELVRSLQPEADVEIIDYRPLRGEINEHRRMLTRRPPWIHLQYWRKLRSVREFLLRHCTLSHHSCTTNDVAVARNFIEKQEYDVVAVGSDTVWEARPSAYAPPFPNIYYLPAVSDVKKIAFAVSADPVLPAYVENGKHRDQMREAAEAFDFISVRDAATERYLAELGVDERRIAFMPDPSVLYDFSEVVERPTVERDRSKPLAGISIGVGSAELKNSIATAVESSGYTVANLCRPAQAEKIFGSPVRSVGQRLGVHGTLDLLVTDRFHSSIFALTLSRCPIIFVETCAKWPLPNSKGRDLFRRLGAEAMVWRHESGVASVDTISSRLDVWEAHEPSARTRLRTLREVAEGTLSRMMEHSICSK